MYELCHTYDMHLVKSIMSVPEIWGDAVEDGVDSNSFFPTQDSLSAWLLVKFKNKIIGVILIHNDTTCSVNIHPMLYKQYRVHARSMMKELFKWFLLLPSHLVKVNCTIPDCFKVVQNFAVKVGFKKEGVNRCSFMKNGNAENQTRFGITREEIEGLL